MDIESYILGRKSAGGGGGGSSLPDVTAADNGDVLTVVNGAWDKAFGPVMLHVDDNTGIADKTWQQMYDLAVAGTPVFLIWDDYDSPLSMNVSQIGRLDHIWEYGCRFTTKTSEYQFYAENADDYLIAD